MAHMRKLQNTNLRDRLPEGLDWGKPWEEPDIPSPLLPRVSLRRRIPRDRAGDVLFATGCFVAGAAVMFMVALALGWFVLT